MKHPLFYSSVLADFLVRNFLYRLDGHNIPERADYLERAFYSSLDACIYLATELLERDFAGHNSNAINNLDVPNDDVVSNDDDVSEDEVSKDNDIIFSGWNGLDKISFDIST